MPSRVVMRTLAVLSVCHLIVSAPEVTRHHRTINEILQSMRQSHQRLSNLVTEERAKWSGLSDSWSYLKQHPFGSAYHDDDQMTTNLEDFMAEQPLLNAKKKNYNQEYTLDQQNLQLIEKADRNIQSVLKNGQCSQPIRRCVKVGSEGRKFLPPCALVHRCGEDSGCCRAEDHVCSVIAQQPIELYFVYVKMSRQLEKRKMRVDKITFMNHTRCGCREKRMSDPQLDRPVKDYPNSSKLPTIRSSVTPRRCQCPKYYTPVLEDATCQCECTDRIPKCFKYSKGRRRFTKADTQCVLTGECATPQCVYGTYDTSTGNCPKKQRLYSKKKKRFSVHKTNIKKTNS